MDVGDWETAMVMVGTEEGGTAWAIEWRIVTDLKLKLFLPTYQWFINFAMNIKLVTRKNSLSILAEVNQGKELYKSYVPATNCTQSMLPFVLLTVIFSVADCLSLDKINGDSESGLAVALHV